jgi:hypothetical protein
MNEEMRMGAIPKCPECDCTHGDVVAIEREVLRKVSAEEFPEGKWLTRCPVTRKIVAVEHLKEEP